jgi:N-acetylmuramic acid 6-phosphate etherase
LSKKPPVSKRPPSSKKSPSSKKPSLSRKPPHIFDEIAALPTESINPRTQSLDEASTSEILEMINREDRLVAPAVAKEKKHIAAAVDMVVAAIGAGGRVFYVGAGTSGRLGVIDAAECPPTFGTPPELFQGIIAGGYGAIIRAREGSEDREDLAGRAIKRRGVGPRDVVVGLAACRRTPYVVAALEQARRIGAATVYITCNPGTAGDEADVVIAVDVGPEVVMGSTRMKCGTAEKLVLNMISTASMVRLGKVYGNMMVDLMANSEKLRQRSVRIIMLATGCAYEEAALVLERAGGSVKVAIVMQLKGLSRKDAVALLKASGGFVKKALSPK